MKKNFILQCLISTTFALSGCGGGSSTSQIDPTSGSLIPTSQTTSQTSIEPTSQITTSDSSSKTEPKVEYTGLIVTKEKTTYQQGETVSIGDLRVFLTNNDNSKTQEIFDYSVSYWQDSTNVGDITNLKAGRYQIWVEAEVPDTKKTISSFEFVYVNARIKSFKIDYEIGVFTQKAGKDVMMDTWRFNLTYANGWTRQLSIASYGVSYEKDSYSTFNAGEYSLLVTYTEENSESRSSLVNYAITD